MNKLEANISLILITFFAAVQYPFLTGVPESVSQFAFLCLTNLVGFVIMLFFFFRELFRLDRKQVLQSMLLSAELVGANTLILMGSATADATVISCVTSAYFVLIPPFAWLMFRQKPNKKTYPGIAVVLLGLFLMMNANAMALLDRGVLFLLGADVFITLYFLTLSRSASNSNPSIIAMGQMFFSFLFTLVLWAAECLVRKTPMTLPASPSFWAAVIYISFFIRGLYGVVEIYALRYAAALNAALIFSTEIVMTMAMSPVMTAVFGTRPEEISPLRVLGAVLMVLGILMTDGILNLLIYRILRGGSQSRKEGRSRLNEYARERQSQIRENRGELLNAQKRLSGRRIWAALMSGFVLYFLFDWGIQATKALEFVPVIGLKNLLPMILGLFSGPVSLLGCCAGCVLTGLLLGNGAAWILAECVTIGIMGVGAWGLWPLLTGQIRPQLKKGRQYITYIAICALLSLLCGLAVFLTADRGAFGSVAASYFFLEVFAGIPVTVLLSSLLWMEPGGRGRSTLPPDISFTLDSSMESLAEGNEQIEEYCMSRRISLAKTMEAENCLEELYLRILKVLPDTDIQADICVSDTFSLRLFYPGTPYNPFKAGEGEDELDMASLKLLRHRALRAAYDYHRSEAGNYIHVVI